jgi:8-oxo-dGTP pyrophosphatase MutT (NUDIX family)
MRNPWRTLASRIVYTNAWMRVREDEIIHPSGRPGIYGVVEMRPSIGVIAADERGNMVLVGQWRYPHRKYSWEIPRGGSHSGETDLLSAAKRELLEETGIEARDWELLGEVDVGNGLTDEVQALYLARGLTIDEGRRDPEEQLQIRWVPFARAIEMVMSHEIVEVCTVAAILIAARRADVPGSLSGPPPVADPSDHRTH